MNVVTFRIKLLDIIFYTYHTMGRDQILPLKPKTVFLLCKVYEGKSMGVHILKLTCAKNQLVLSTKMLLLKTAHILGVKFQNWGSIH